MDSVLPIVVWGEEGGRQESLWRSENGSPPPKRLQVVGDQISADAAYRLACEGTALIWQGDYQNARQLIQAMGRRLDRKKAKKPAASALDAFNLHRQSQAQRARVLGMVLVPLDADYKIPLRRAPDVKLACEEAYGPSSGASLVSLREILGLIGAHEWRKKGVEIPALGAAIHPHYGVFSPVRGEYIDLLAKAPLPSTNLAFDIGTGSGVLAALLAKRGVHRVIATDQDPRALACAKENLARLGLGDQVEVIAADMFPAGKSPLVVCNPPWLPARPSAAIEFAVYDPDSRMLKGFLSGLASHLEPGGEGWLILSDFAEHLGLRQPGELQSLITNAGLHVLGRLDIKPRHGKAQDPSDPLYQARQKEVTSLWRLGIADHGLNGAR